MYTGHELFCNFAELINNQCRGPICILVDQLLCNYV